MAVTIRAEFNRFPELASSLQSTIDGALNAGVETCIAVADPLTPVDTGMLKANKSIEASADGRTITWNQNYAAYVEMGTYKMSARPFAGPGADAAVPVIAAELGKFGS